MIAFAVLLLWGTAQAATRMALVSGQSSAEVESALDTATALLSQDKDLQLLDRAEVSRVLREQQLSLAGLVGAEHAVKAGQLLHADLFAVLEEVWIRQTEAYCLCFVASMPASQASKPVRELAVRLV